MGILLRALRIFDLPKVQGRNALGKIINLESQGPLFSAIFDNQGILQMKRTGRGGGALWPQHLSWEKLK